MDSPLLKIAEGVGSLAGFVMAIYFTYWRVRQGVKSKELALEDNPERCGRHEEAIKTLQERVQRIEEKNDEAHVEMFRQIGGLCVEVAKLSKNGNGPK